MNKTRIALAVSLAVNLLVAGAVGGALLTGGGPQRSGPPELRSFSRGLDSDRRDELRARMRGDAELRGGRARLRAARADTVAALRADPFEPEELRAALAAQQALQTDLVTRALAAMVATAADMSPAERAVLADALERRRR